MAIRFDVENDCIYRTTGLPSITNFTIMAWVKLSVDRNANSTFWKYGQGVATEGFRAYMPQTTADGVTLITYNGATGSATGSVLTVGTWYHIAQTVSGTGAGQFLTYLDGVLNITHSGSTAPTATEMVFGDWDTTGFEPYNGCVAAIKVYSAVLTAAEIAVERTQYAPLRTENIVIFTDCLSSTEATINRYGTAWTVGGTLSTEDGPPIPWSINEDYDFIGVSTSNFVQRERGIRGLNRGLLAGVR